MNGAKLAVILRSAADGAERTEDHDLMADAISFAESLRDMADMCEISSSDSYVFTLEIEDRRIEA